MRVHDNIAAFTGRTGAAKLVVLTREKRLLPAHSRNVVKFRVISWIVFPSTMNRRLDPK
jgi:hypothetical protein